MGIFRYLKKVFLHFYVICDDFSIFRRCKSLTKNHQKWPQNLGFAKPEETPNSLTILFQVKMALITEAFFREGDFSRLDLIHQTFDNLNGCLTNDLGKEHAFKK